MTPENRFSQPQKRELLFPRQKQWFHLVALPSTPKGLTLKLTESRPRQLSLEENAVIQPIVSAYQREKEGTPGYHNPTKVNMHPSITGDTITYTATPTTYAEFMSLVGNPSIPQHIQEEARLTSMNIVWLTNEPDGKRRLIYEIRGKYSGYFPSAIGPSASGSWDNDIMPDGKLAQPTPDNAVKHLFEETEQELGLPFSLLQESSVKESVVVTGLVQDLKKPHYNILYMGQLPVSAQEVQSYHDAHIKNGNDKYEDPIAPHIGTIEATPTAIRTLLTKVHSPLTPVTQATMIAAGYMLTMQQALSQGKPQEYALKKAVHWQRQTEYLMAENYREIDRVARRHRNATITREAAKAVAASIEVFLRRHPEKKKKALQRNQIATEKALEALSYRNGFDPIREPEKQGLPSAKEALQRVEERQKRRARS